MSDHNHEFDSDADRTPIRHGQLSSNGHWLFGSIYAGLALVGFSFGVWAGAAKPKPPETADAKPKEVSYATTARFLEMFGLQGLDDLPKTHDLQQM